MPRRSILPLSLYLGGRRSLVVGRGPGADERASRLAAAGAQVDQVAPEDYQPGLCAGAFLVVAQSGDPDLDRRAAQDARAAGALGYAHDQPDVSDLAFPALARRGPLTIAVATDGTAPALARRVREELERVLGAAGAALDRLIDRYQRERAARPPGPRRAAYLLDLARRLRLTGGLEVQSDDGNTGQADGGNRGDPER